MVGIVGAGGIGGTLFAAFQRFDYDFVCAILISIISLIMVGEVLATAVRAIFIDNATLFDLFRRGGRDGARAPPRGRLMARGRRRVPLPERVWRRFTLAQRLTRFLVYLAIVAAIVASVPHDRGHPGVPRTTRPSRSSISSRGCGRSTGRTTRSRCTPR